MTNFVDFLKPWPFYDLPSRSFYSNENKHSSTFLLVVTTHDVGQIDFFLRSDNVGAIKTRLYVHSNGND